MDLTFDDEQRERLRRKLSRLFKADVPETTELRRILALPRRDWLKDDVAEGLDINDLVELLTEHFKREGGTQVLWPVQVKALQDAHDIGGLFGPIPVGLGKTLISLLAAVALEAERPLLVIPARLRGKTQMEREEYALHWKPPQNLSVVSYEKLSRENGTAFLENCNPDLLIFDECFSAGTRIETLKGLVPIEKLMVGDFVVSGDGTSQAVENTYCRKTTELLELVLGNQRIYCTSNHPFLTAKGWKNAGQLREKDEVVQLVQEGTGENEEESILFKKLFCFLANESTGAQGQSAYKSNSNKNLESCEEVCSRTSRIGREELFKDAAKQPNERPQNQGKSLQNTQNQKASTGVSRRKRTTDTCTSSEVSGSIGLGLRIRSGCEGAQDKKLQNRHRQPGNKSRCRSGWRESQEFKSTSSRCPQNTVFRRARLVSVTSIQRRSTNSHMRDCRVYNLQVRGSHTYLAEGFVVHNCHRLKNTQAAVTRRIAHWMDEHPDTRVIAMSGTITKRSLLDFVHLVRWCLPETGQPLPRYPKELEAWAAAVDVIKSHEQRTQGGVGALRLFCNEEESTQGRDGVRSAVRRRIQETPGVVASQGQGVEASLNIVLTKIDGYSQRTEELARGLLEKKKPNGDVITARDLAARWRLFRTLTSGFWYQWEPRPPKEWLKRRRAWKWFVNSVLDEFIPGLESEALVAKAVKAGRLGRGEREYQAWQEVKDTYKPDVFPVWEDLRMIEAVQAWTVEHRGIVWVSEVALGEELERRLGLPYYHEMGLNSRGYPIEKTHPGEGCIVASVGSNSEGRNLQAWSDNLIISPPPTGTVVEQILGRTHRPGQEADEVWAEVFFGCRVEWECWLQAMRDAEYASEIEGPKKLTYATIERTFTPEYGGNALWPVQ